MELVLLHALPLDASMWRGQRDLLPGATVAPTLYGLGAGVGDWAAGVLRQARGDRLILVGCSVGGSCALEMAAAAPERVAALVLVGAKAAHRPDPALHDSAIATIRAQGLAAAWEAFWAPRLSPAAAPDVRRAARRIALRQSPCDIERGVTAFHTRPDRTATLAQFAGPVVVVAGAQDSAPGLRTSAAQAASARQGRLHIVPDCGHYVPLERPGALNGILREMIAGLG